MAKQDPFTGKKSKKTVDQTKKKSPILKKDSGKTSSQKKNPTSVPRKKTVTSIKSETKSQKTSNSKSMNKVIHPTLSSPVNSSLKSSHVDSEVQDFSSKAHLEPNFPDTDFAAFSEGNMSAADRLISGAAGIALMIFGLSKRSLKGIVLALAGGGLAYRGLRGHSHVYDWMGMGTSSSQPEEGLILEGSVRIAQPSKKVYEYVRQPENLLRLWGTPIKVKTAGESKIQWTLQGIDGSSIDLDAELVADVTNRLVAWRSFPDAPISHEGSIYLHDAGVKDTDMTVMLKYDPPGSHRIARYFGGTTNDQFMDKLLRLKREIEDGQKNKDDL